MPTPVDMPTLAVEVAFSAGANPNAWILGYSPLPVTLGEALVDTYTDVAAALRGPMRITRGKNRELEVYQPGRVSARLDNRDREYDPLNLNGTHVSGGATLIKPGRRVRVKATHPTTAVQYDLLRGFARDWQPEYTGQHDATTTLIATDALTDLSRTEIDLTTTAGLSGQAVAAVLTDAGVSGFDVDTGNSTFGAATLTGKAIEALRQMERAEQGQFYVERDGVVTFLERHALLQNDRHMRPQAYFGAGPFAGSAHNYLKGLSPALLLGLGEASGDAVDESANLNNGTVTIGAGARDAAALDYGGDGATTYYEGTTNIVPNPSAEVNTTGFLADGSPGGTNPATLTRDSGYAASGSWSYKCVTPGSVVGEGFGTPNTAIAATAGTVYTLSAYMKGNVGGELIDATIWWRKADGSTISSSIAHAVLTTSGVRYQVTATAPALTAYAEVAFSITSGMHAYTWWTDAIQLEAKAYATTYCDGSLGTGYSWSGTAHASTSTRAATKVVVPDATTIQNIWDGGGAAAVLFNLNSVGEAGFGRLLSKGEWDLFPFDESGGTYKLRLQHNFSGTQGQWDFTNRVFTTGRTYAAIPLYNSSATTNDPTIYVYDFTAATWTAYTVGGGLTENSTPVGTRVSDVGSDLVVGNTSAGSFTADGEIDELAMWKAAQPTVAQGTEWATLAATGIPTSPIDFTEDGLKVAYESDLIVNTVNVTRTSGVKQTASDADSEAAYGPSDLSYSDLPLASDTLALNLAEFVLGQKKDPAVRIRSVTIAPRRSAAIMTEALSRRLMDRIAVGFTPAGGGDAVLQECFIIGIEHEIDGSRDYMRTTFTLAPTEHVDTAWLLGRGRLGDTSGLDSTVLTSF